MLIVGSIYWCITLVLAPVGFCAFLTLHAFGKLEIEHGKGIVAIGISCQIQASNDSGHPVLAYSFSCDIREGY